MEQSALTPILLQTKMPEVPPELAQVIGRALMKDPQQRFADVNAFASALVPLLLPKPSPDESLPGEDGSSTSSQSSTGPARLFNQNRTRSGTVRAVGISLILIVVFLTGGVFLFSGQRAGVSSAQATQTAIVRGTQQAVATFTAHPDQEIYTLATRGKLSINDPLNTKSKSTWQTFQMKSDGCTFNDGAYTLRNSEAKTYLNCKSIGTTFHNFAFEVEMSIIKGSSGGITLRANGDNSKFYALRVGKIASDSYYDFVSYNNESQKEIQNTIINGVTQKSSMLSVIAYENTFYFYIDKKFLMKAQDNSLSSGTVGMYIGNTDGAVSETAFRNAKVWTL